jgi:hypothetical protein
MHSHQGSAGQGGFDFAARSIREPPATAAGLSKIYEKVWGRFVDGNGTYG